MAFHRLRQLVARGVRREIQLLVQSVELKHVMMERTRTSARTEVGGCSPAGGDTRAVARAIRQVTGSQSFRQTLGGSGDVERGPVERVRWTFGGRIFNVVKNDSVALQSFGSRAGVATCCPIEGEFGRLVLSVERILKGHFTAIGKRCRGNREYGTCRTF